MNTEPNQWLTGVNCYNHNTMKLMTSHIEHVRGRVLYLNDTLEKAAHDVAQEYDMTVDEEAMLVILARRLINDSLI